jgi:hypothetical protein
LFSGAWGGFALVVAFVVFNAVIGEEPHAWGLPRFCAEHG